MAIFAILMPSPQPRLAEAIKTSFPTDHFTVNETQWLISTTGTVFELAAKLGIYDPKEPNKLATGSAIVLATSAYFGRAPANVWEWMRAKLETPSSG